MQPVPLDLKVSPPSLDEIEQWKSELLWRPQSKDDIVDFIKSKIKPHPEVKSGVVLYRDFALNCFQTIAFNARKIFQPEDAQAVVKIKRPDNGKPTLTFEEKQEALKAFVLSTGRFPTKEDKFDEGPNLYTFYNSLLKNQKKYDDIIQNCKSDSGDDASGEAAAARRDDGNVGRGRVLGRRGGSDELEEDEIPLDEEESPKKAKKPKQK